MHLRGQVYEFAPWKWRTTVTSDTSQLLTQARSTCRSWQSRTWRLI